MQDRNGSKSNAIAIRPHSTIHFTDTKVDLSPKSQTNKHKDGEANHGLMGGFSPESNKAPKNPVWFSHRTIFSSLICTGLVSDKCGDKSATSKVTCPGCSADCSFAPCQMKGAGWCNGCLLKYFPGFPQGSPKPF